MTFNQSNLICPNPKAISTRDVLDHDVFDLEDKQIGVVSDVVFEANNGMMAYVSISLQNSRRLVVPFEAILINPDDGRIQLKMYSESIILF
ncbi:MAG TPA: hypothetical protein DCM28_09215 [Phycisphaerales bacterium]|nr:hypothetical protein [Phycisphaerales bacterium]HCD31003.1 hypothetical protein [Phycisphaerales bacterium]|tara:strand:- start:2777 stop:3049 length:273 start_codon:yes stop_codon:yes gene_type:complete